MASLGFDMSRLVGNELLPERAAATRRQLPTATALPEGDALSFGDGSFDPVYQPTVFSSLLDDAMPRWVRPGGAVLWYDFTYDNPRNPDVRGVALVRVRALFPNARIDARRVTPAPSLSRRAARLHPRLCSVLNALPLLRTHLLRWIGKPR